jgi:hypothetical protein
VSHGFWGWWRTGEYGEAGLPGAGVAAQLVDEVESLRADAVVAGLRPGNLDGVLDLHGSIEISFLVQSSLTLEYQPGLGPW